jgi:predicted TIM-barrel fold metal-dependent hydrolase
VIHDLHRHLWPEPFLAALRDRAEAPRLDGWTLHLADGSYPIDPDAYGPERCLAELDRDGVGVALVSLPPTFGLELLPSSEAELLVGAYHDGVLEAVAGSRGRLRALAADRPRDGFAGVCVPATALADLDALAPVADELERRGELLFVHPGLSPVPDGAPPWWQAVVGYTAQMQAAYAAWLAEGIDRWPDLRVLFAILAGGGPFQLERLRSRGFEARRAQRRTLFFDVASYGSRAIELCLATLGGGALVFGSDAPVIDPRPTLAAVRSFGEAVVNVLCQENPEGLLSARDA